MEAINADRRTMRDRLDAVAANWAGAAAVVRCGFMRIRKLGHEARMLRRIWRVVANVNRKPSTRRDSAIWVMVCAVMATDMATAQAQPADVFNYSRTTSFTYLPNGLIASETLEPNRAELCVSTTYIYDGNNSAIVYGNRTGVTTSNCTGASGLAQISSRTSTSAFEAQIGRIASIIGTQVPVPAGMFQTRVSNALSQSESRTYDPRFGVVLRLTGPNALNTDWTVDAFGRRTVERRADTTRTARFFCWLKTPSPNFSRTSIDTSSNTANCPVPSAAEVPDDAVRFEHSVSQDSAGVAIGAFERTYFDRAGRKIRSVTEAPDGATTAAGAARLIVQDTDYSEYGVASVTTQPYFLDSGSSSTSGAGDYGMTLTEVDVLGRPVAVYATLAGGPQQEAGAGGVRQFGTRGNRQTAKTAYAYAGLTTITTDDKGRTRKEERDPAARLIRVTDGSGSSVDAGAQIAYQHDAFGNLLTTKDALGNLIRVTYDIRGRRLTLNDPDAGVTSYCYDALGQLKAQQSSEMRVPKSHTPEPCPTVSGAGSTAPSVAKWTTFAYDVTGRLTHRISPEYATTWAYDNCAMGVGKLCGSSTTNGVTRRVAYDGLGRPVNSRTDVTGGPTMATAVSYDTATGRINNQTYPTGLRVSYRYSGKGYMNAVHLDTQATLNPLPATPGGRPGAATTIAATTIAANTRLWYAVQINAWGQAEQTSYANEINNRRLLDPQNGRLLNLRAGRGDTNNVVDHRYSWDRVGQLSQRIDAIGDNTGIQVADTLEYDKLGRLTQYQVSGGTSGTPATRTVTLKYNALGMLLSKSDVGNFTYPAQGVANGRPHAVTSVVGAYTASYTYDLNGNARTASGGSWRSMTYTSFNLPDGASGVQGPAGSPKLTWQYDENHQRIKEVRVNAQGTRTTWYLHPDNQGGLGFEREVAPNGQQSNRHYVSAGGSAFAVIVTSGALPTLASTATAPTVLTTVAAVKVEYWHKDHLGSLIATTDHAGAVTGRYAYDPFGKRRYTTGTYDAFGALIVDWRTDVNSGTDRGFTGHEHLDDVGLIHMNGRLFDPVLGRFLQADPLIQDPNNLQNYDRYAYCYNNPLTCVDPTGLSAWTKFRDGFIMAAAVALDLSGYCGYCTAAVAGYRGYKAGGWQGAFFAAVTAQIGMQFGPAGEYASYAGFWQAAAGCINAEASGGKCGQGAVSGLVSYFGGQYGPWGAALAGCANAKLQGGNCGRGAGDGLAGYYGGRAGTYVTDGAVAAHKAYERQQAEARRAAQAAGYGDGYDGGGGSGDEVKGGFRKVGYLFNQVAHGDDRPGAGGAPGFPAPSLRPLGELIYNILDTLSAPLQAALDWALASDVQYVIRGGLATPGSLAAGSGPVRAPYDSLTGFSVTTAPKMSIDQLALVANYPNGQISWTTVQELAKIGVPVVPTPFDRMPLHGTAVVPIPLDPARATQISNVFRQMKNPARGPN